MYILGALGIRIPNHWPISGHPRIYCWNQAGDLTGLDLTGYFHEVGGPCC